MTDRVANYLVALVVVLFTGWQFYFGTTLYDPTVSPPIPSSVGILVLVMALMGRLVYEHEYKQGRNAFAALWGWVAQLFFPAGFWMIAAVVRQEKSQIGGWWVFWIFGFMLLTAYVATGLEAFRLAKDAAEANSGDRKPEAPNPNPNA